MCGKCKQGRRACDQCERGIDAFACFHRRDRGWSCESGRRTIDGRVGRIGARLRRAACRGLRGRLTGRNAGRRLHGLAGRDIGVRLLTSVFPVRSGRKPLCLLCCPVLHRTENGCHPLPAGKDLRGRRPVSTIPLSDDRPGTWRTGPSGSSSDSPECPGDRRL